PRVPGGRGAQTRVAYSTSVLSRKKPAVVISGDCVLPTSATSGLSAPESDGVSLSTRPVQDCSSIVRVLPGFSSSNVVLRYSRAASGVSEPLSQTQISPVAASPSPEPV